MTSQPEKEKLLDEWHDAVGPWQPNPLTRPLPAMPARRRLALLAAIAAGHVAMLMLLAHASGIVPDTGGDTTTVVLLFPDPVPEVPEPPPVPKPEPPQEPKPDPPTPARVPTTTPPAAAPPDTPSK